MMYSLSILPQASLHVKSVHVEVAGSCAPLAAFGGGGRNRGIYVTAIASTAIPKDRYPGVELVDFWAGVSPSQLRRDDNSANHPSILPMMVNNGGFKATSYLLTCFL